MTFETEAMSNMYNCSTPTFPLTGSVRMFYAASCMAIIVASIAFQIVFVLTCQKMKGWKSDFAFYLLQLMAFFNVMSYIGHLLSYINGLMLFDSPVLSKVTGSNYLCSFIAFVLADLCLTVHRFIYTLLPVKAQSILTKRTERMCIAFIFIFYGTYTAITLSPLASVEFCATHFSFYQGDALIFAVISWIPQMFNYAFGFVDVTAYVIMFTTLFIKGSLTFRKNSEIRMTAQAAMVSVIQLLFFVYWEFVYPPSSEWWQLMEGYSTLIYSDVLFLPYVIFNKQERQDISWDRLLKIDFCLEFGISAMLSFGMCIIQKCSDIPIESEDSAEKLIPEEELAITACGHFGMS